MKKIFIFISIIWSTFVLIINHRSSNFNSLGNTFYTNKRWFVFSFFAHYFI